MFLIPRRWLAITFVLLAGATASSAHAQSSCVATVGTVERSDVPRMAGGDSLRSILRDVTECTKLQDKKTFRIRPLLPRLRVAGSAGLPLAQNDGELWVGRGTNAAIRTGFAFDAGVLHLAVAPEFVWSGNSPFDHEPARDTSRSSFASPFYSAPSPSIDFPTQFGASALNRITPGASAIWLSAFGVSGGLSASQQQWGPGRRGSLLLGTSTAGIPRAFLRTTHPVVTAVGSFDAVLFLGTLTESSYFDRNDANDYRSLSAFGISWSPDTSARFTLGAARGVMHTSDKAQPAVSRTLNALASTDSLSDDLFSAFARIGAASDPLSVWVELARNREGFGLRSFLTLPYDATSYIVGARGTAQLRRGQLVVLGEAANLEQGEDVTARAPKDFYAGTHVPQGWTQRGRPIGHWVGPGGQTQFISIDWLLHNSRAGIFVERVRRNEDALFREFLAYPNRHDVSIDIGVRGAVAWRQQEFALELSNGKRLNFEFQNATYLPSVRTVDVVTPRIRFSVTPMSQR